ncbi:MAG: hypothetical protein QF926_08815 [Alphaproteobacteria bacterium]|nr:hypothetical protein [Alphaproteobacteria bacterium]MDP6516706.1 hypothetical protein [Alphaproteobacteria bacterium]
MGILYCAAALLWAMASVIHIARAAEPPTPEPLAALGQNESDLPPVGRSLFEFLFAREVDGAWVVDVPYPFETLIAQIEAGLRDGYRQAVKRSLYPLARSLHRHAADPHYFRYPRAVAAVDTESEPAAGRSGLMLKDRLYIGYQPTTDSIEAIAYNEAAGRFEYHVVTDYREGGRPEVTYAARGLCTGCHQNQALIYGEQPWDESNANTRVAALLRAEADFFYGIPAQVAVDIPESFDESTDRANFFAAYQVAWNQGCQAAGDRGTAIGCRRDGLIAALRYRLTGGYQLGDRGDGAYDRFAAHVTRGWYRQWPAGVAIPTPDLLDRDPLADFDYGTGRVGAAEGLSQLTTQVSPDLVYFEEIYEPLYPRPPLETWKVAPPLLGLDPVAPEWLKRVVAGLGDFLAAADIERLDAALARHSAPRREIAIPCTVAPEPATDNGRALTFRCDDRGPIGLALNGRLRASSDGTAAGIVHRVRSDSAAPGGLTLEHARLARTDTGWRARFRLRDIPTGLGARLADGNRLDQVSLSWPAVAPEGAPATAGPVAATAVLTVAEDFPLLVAAIDRLAADTRAGRGDALANAPFRRVALLRPIFADLGLGPIDWCCLEADHLPPARLHDD